MALTDLALALLVRTAEQLEQQAVDLRSVVDEELTLESQPSATQVRDESANYYPDETRAALVPIIEAAYELERLSSDLRAQVSTHALERYQREDLFAVLSKDFGPGERLQKFGATLREIAHLSLPPLPQGDSGATDFLEQEKNLYSINLVQSLRYDAYLRGWRDCIFITPPLLLDGDESSDEEEISGI
jgi:hypothetical protein